MTEHKVEFVSADRVFTGLIVEPGAAVAKPRPGVMVFHGGAGPSSHERERARMLAELGYVAFAPDLFGEVFRSRERGVEVITGLVGDPRALRERLLDALAFFRAQDGVDASRVAAIGFCFGGLAALELARSGAQLRAAVSFHGGLTTRSAATPGAVTGSVLVCTGAADPFITRDHRVTFEEEMTRANADWQLHVHARAMHGFTERTAEGKPQRPGSEYDENADRRSWLAMRALLSEVFDRADGLSV